MEAHPSEQSDGDYCTGDGSAIANENEDRAMKGEYRRSIRRDRIAMALIDECDEFAVAIDRFILAKLEANALKPAAPAEASGGL